MLNVELIKQVERTFHDLKIGDRTSDSVVAKIGHFPAAKVSFINDTYQEISKKINYLRDHIPRFMELGAQKSKDDDQGH
jgi:hypothetical protein